MAGQVERSWQSGDFGLIDSRSVQGVQGVQVKIRSLEKKWVKKSTKEVQGMSFDPGQPGQPGQFANKLTGHVRSIIEQ